MPTTAADAQGEGVQKASGKALTEIGQTGLSIWQGRVRDEYLPQLQGDRAIRTFRQMADNDPVAGSLLLAVEMLVRQLDWRVDPRPETKDPANADRWALHVNSCLHDMSQSWEATLASILSFLTYGWSFHEIVYKIRGGDVDDPTHRSQYDDGLFGWRKLPIRVQESLIRWDVDDSGSVQGMVQQPRGFVSAESRTIPMEVGLLFRTTSARGNPEGRSIFRNAYRPWYFKNRFEEIEGMGIERDLAGIPTGLVPPAMLSADATPDQKATRAVMEAMLRDIKRDDQEFILWPLSFDTNGNLEYDIKLLSTGGRRQIDIDPVIARYDQRMLMVALADFILLGHEKVGSYALGAAKKDFFTMAVGAWADEIASVFNEFAIPRLVKLNGGTLDVSPVLVHDEVREIDLTALGNYVLARAKAGEPLFPNPALSTHLNAVAGLPEDENPQQDL